MRLNSIIPQNPCDVIFWTGAGISIDNPSNLPSGASLTEEVVTTFCEQNTWLELCKYFQEGQIEDSIGKIKKIPRLEEILGNVVSILGFEILNNFSFLDAPPNHFHYFFAHHIRARGKHITLNLDLCIENAIKNLVPFVKYHIITPDMISSKWSNHGWILHLHGKYGDNLSSLGLTIENVTRGIGDEISRFIIETLFSKKVIIFVGYSGSDFFDVNPFFKDFGNHEKLAGMHAIWLEYSSDSESSDFLEYDKSHLKISILDSLAESKVKIYVRCGNSMDIINELSAFWGFPSLIKPSTLVRKDRIKLSVEEWKKEIVTAKVYISMGLGERALTLAKKIEHSRKKYESYCANKSDLIELSPSNRISYIINEAKREYGLYFDAHKITERFIQITDLDKMLYLERSASDFWLMGRLFKSKKIFTEGLFFGIQRLGQLHRFDMLYIECLRGYMQLCRDFGRLLIIGDILLKRYIKDALNAIAFDSRIEDALKMSHYDRSHIARLLEWEKPNLKKLAIIPKWLNDTTNIKFVFSETDNFLGTINTMRSEIKRTLYLGQKVKNEKLLSLLHLCELIIDHPGIVKAYQLLVFNGDFKTKYVSNFFRSLFKTQWVATRKINEIVVMVQ